LLAPAVGEVLAGSTPLDLMGSPAIFVAAFLLQALLYGGGAIVIREVARRWGSGWWTIAGLGVAYALLEEGLVTQSFFNPNFLGLHLLGMGTLFGLGWVWITDMIPLHVVWSIGVPILLTELLFRGPGTEPWLRRPGLAVAGVLLAAGMVGTWLGIFTTNRHFLAPWPVLAVTAALIVATAALALRPPRVRWISAATVSAGPPQATAPSPWLVGAASLAAASAFMGIHQLLGVLPAMPGAVPVAVTLALALGALLVLPRWAARAGWGPAHRLALAGGALLTYAWNGFLTIPLGDRIDVVGQAVADGLAVAFVVGLAVSLARRSASFS
jgi:hypothetical protein